MTVRWRRKLGRTFPQLVLANLQIVEGVGDVVDFYADEAPALAP